MDVIDLLSSDDEPPAPSPFEATEEQDENDEAEVAEDQEAEMAEDQEDEVAEDQEAEVAEGQQEGAPADTGPAFAVNPQANDEDDDEDVVMTSTSSANAVYAHARSDCSIHLFGSAPAHLFCDMCYCYIW
jgi:hypothetical protein